MCLCCRRRSDSRNFETVVCIYIKIGLERQHCSARIETNGYTHMFKYDVFGNSIIMIPILRYNQVYFSRYIPIYLDEICFTYLTVVYLNLNLSSSLFMELYNVSQRRTDGLFIYNNSLYFTLSLTIFLS